MRGGERKKLIVTQEDAFSSWNEENRRVFSVQSPEKSKASRVYASGERAFSKKGGAAERRVQID